MGLDSKHPSYVEMLPDWEQMRDTFKGERQVKERGFRYLPATSGMVIDGISTMEQRGWQAYDAYRRRSRFPELVGDAVESMLGVMHYKPPAIQLPAKLEPLREKATLRGESLAMLLRRINEEQLVVGRVGMLLEVPAGESGPVLPFIATYNTESIFNWDEGTRDGTQKETLNLVVLCESEDERQDDLEWKRVEKYRVLVLGDVNQNEAAGLYSVATFRETSTFSTEQLLQPSISGKTLERIPFVIANVKDVVASADSPPLIGLSNLCLGIYRGEADYRQALFMQGQDTLVVIGGTLAEGETRRIGAGSSIDLPQGGDAKFIGVNSSGLPEMREALTADYARGEDRSKGLVESVSRAAESGEALRVRVSARTASLNQIALTGAFALQELLRIAAEWVGANPEEVIVTPNLDFVSDTMKAQELTGLMAAKGLGAPLSLQSIHAAMQARGLTELSLEEELEIMAEEARQGLPGATPPDSGEEGRGESTDPEGPEDDDEEDEEEDDTEAPESEPA